ncbi:MAG: hypothetical protein LBE23_10910 [Vagococcus sp.]|jgi:hypothetical protein|nr:hypothetical protein [Vagococcus sp.]
MKKIILNKSIIGKHQKYCDVKIKNVIEDDITKILESQDLCGKLDVLKLREKYKSSEEIKKVKIIKEVFDSLKKGDIYEDILKDYSSVKYKNKNEIFELIKELYEKSFDIKKIMDDKKIKNWWNKSSNAWHQKMNFNKVNCDELRYFIKEIYPKLNLNDIDNLVLLQEKIKKRGERTSYELIYHRISETYETFSSQYKSKEWSAKVFTEQINTIVCPYCNMNFIHTYYNERTEEGKPKGTVRPEIDHFYPKSKYPLLAMSIYNLIPSCHQCNSSIKGNFVMNHKEYLHPYLDDMDEIVLFNRKIMIGKDSYKTCIGLNDKFTIEANPKIRNDMNFTRAQETLKFFHIIELLEEKKHVIQREVRKEIIYNESYRNELKNILNHEISKEDVKITSYDIEKEILGKLYNDIFYSTGHQTKMTN